MSLDWRGTCAAFAATQGLPHDPLLPLLEAFGRPGDEALLGWTFESLEQGATAGLGPTTSAILAGLAGEIDPDQARVFARRYASVATLLAGLADRDARARVLAVGLWRRVHDVLAAEAPRALRVRAVVDFYYSQAAVVHHQLAGGPPLSALLEAATWREAAPGVAHATIDGPTAAGPVHLNLLSVSPGCRLATADARGQSDFATWVASQGAVAGTSGGFFLYSEADIEAPSSRHDLVGLLVEDGRVRAPPVLRRSALVQHRDGRVTIEQLGPTGATLVPALGPSLRPVSVNGDPTQAPPTAAAPALPVPVYNRAFGAAAPCHPGTTALVVGTTLVALLPGAVAAPIPLNGLAIALPPGLPPIEGPIAWHLDGTPTAAISGGPRLLHQGAPCLDRAVEDLAGTAPPVTFSQDETYDQNLLPRLAVGQRPDGTLIFAAIDGRNLERAPGFTLRGTAQLLADLGCTEALNLDGGSSKRMVVAGRVVDMPSTEVVAGEAGPPRVRPVHSAVLVYPSQS